MVEEERQPEAEELEAAQALQKAIDRGVHSEELPEEAFATAALLSTLRGPGLDPERSRALISEVLDNWQPPAHPTETPGMLDILVHGWRLLIPGAAVALAVTVATGRPVPPLPQPSTALLHAQLKAVESLELTGDEQMNSTSLLALKQEMRAYRGEVLASVRRRVH